MVGLSAKRETAAYLREQYKFSERRTCRLIRLWRSTKRYSKKDDDSRELRQRMRFLSERWRRFGYRRIHVMIKREGIQVNHKKVYRIYREEKLSLRAKKRKKYISVTRTPLPTPSAANERWSMDFVSDQLGPNGRRFRCLNIVDDFTRECLAIVVDTSLPGERVAETLDRLAFSGRRPKAIVIDNGPELTGRALDEWAFKNQVKLEFIRPGKPTENAFIESFNGKFRDECLNENWFTGLQHAQEIIEEWRQNYNSKRPHSSLGGLTPEEFAKKTA